MTYDTTKIPPDEPGPDMSGLWDDNYPGIPTTEGGEVFGPSRPDDVLIPSPVLEGIYWNQRTLAVCNKEGHRLVSYPFTTIDADRTGVLTVNLNKPKEEQRAPLLGDEVARRYIRACFDRTGRVHDGTVAELAAFYEHLITSGELIRRDEMERHTRITIDKEHGPCISKRITHGKYVLQPITQERYDYLLARGAKVLE